jgi:hypothetical protein
MCIHWVSKVPGTKLQNICQYEKKNPAGIKLQDVCQYEEGGVSDFQNTFVIDRDCDEIRMEIEIRLCDTWQYMY